MTNFGLLDHDISAYSLTFTNIIEISRTWHSRRSREAHLQPLEELWKELADGDPAWALPKSMVAHLLADLQTDPKRELHWDIESLRALSYIWEQSTDRRLFDVGCRCLPSIYLSLAGAARKCGDSTAAREYIRRARLTLPVLPETPYTNALSSAIENLHCRLAAGSAG